MTVAARAATVLKRKDIAAGLLLAAFGVAGLALGTDLPMGVARRMGPGFVPFGLSMLLILFGGVIALGGILRDGETIERVRLRPLVGVLAGGIAFALLIDTGGILLATFAAVAGAAAADSHTRWLQAAALAVISAIFSAILFVELLQLPIRLWFR
ncbi:tripartite tricarboxylate transporter TctB family protein [Stella humosa]|uniref:Tripartite tricarboxylate transporter TctB family protein n=1 Tax=Stella humosa TaxID=94 RepID=A0A3N1MDV4_9PROT|nr:tripartite tricarboxylate transporter TctB family protein [Stella humosa]ROQ01911.1 tripartite tricarboxylate transporter TctB family protein [Stella humosa]BBK32300.1 hypothetical protein STHU_29340 [Stella humosa]